MTDDPVPDVNLNFSGEDTDSIAIDQRILANLDSALSEWLRLEREQIARLQRRIETLSGPSSVLAAVSGRFSMTI